MSSCSRRASRHPVARSAEAGELRAGSARAGTAGPPGCGGTVDRLRAGRVEMVPAAELVRRMSGRALPDVSAPRVQREIDRIRDGKRLRPVLAVGDAIADGEHRLAAVAHVNPSAPVAVFDRGNTENERGPSVQEKIRRALQNGAAAAADRCRRGLRSIVTRRARRQADWCRRCERRRRPACRMTAPRLPPRCWTARSRARTARTRARLSRRSAG